MVPFILRTQIKCYLLRKTFAEHLIQIRSPDTIIYTHYSLSQMIHTLFISSVAATTICH